MILFMVVILVEHEIRRRQTIRIGGSHHDSILVVGSVVGSVVKENGGGMRKRLVLLYFFFLKGWRMGWRWRWWCSIKEEALMMLYDSNNCCQWICWGGWQCLFLLLLIGCGCCGCCMEGMHFFHTTQECGCLWWGWPISSVFSFCVGWPIRERERESVNVTFFFLRDFVDGTVPLKFTTTTTTTAGFVFCANWNRQKERGEWFMKLDWLVEYCCGACGWKV